METRKSFCCGGRIGFSVGALPCFPEGFVWEGVDISLFIDGKLYLYTLYIRDCYMQKYYKSKRESELVYTEAMEESGDRKCMGVHRYKARVTSTDQLR
jgi:hypothetical protein